ncbi:MAG: TIGR03032 family protein, partial [Synechococcaceae cyanobacterium]
PRAGQPLFVNTAFSCLAGVARGSSFTPLWQPPFLTRLAADDACHLNGVALRDGEPAWASACGHQDGPSSWRNDRRSGGGVRHIPRNGVVATGLSWPPAPRWHQGRLWLLNSGSGELGWIEHDRFQPLCALPGFSRGLSFAGDCAVVGLSKLRSPQFTGLALDERLAAEGIPGGCCGLRVVDLATGALLHSLDLPEPIDELFDVVALPGVRQPLALGLQDEDIHCLVRLPDPLGQVRVRPLAPSGNPHQGPALTPFGLPAVSPVAPGAGQADGGLAVPDPTVAAGPIRYQKVLLLTPATLAPYAALTYPSLAPGRAALERISGELLGLCAMADGAMVALALAERRSEGGAGLVSLMVAPSWRRRGIGTGLLLRLQRFLASEGIAPLEVRYLATTLTSAAFEPILARLGWQAPRIEQLLLKGHSSRLVAVGWADRHPLRPPYSLVAWGQLSDRQRRVAADRGGQVLGPGPDPEELQPDPQLSLALLHHGEPVGWLLVQRTGADSVRYASLFVAPAHRGRARALALLHEGFRRQHAAAIPLARAAVAPGQDGMERLLRRHLGVHLQAIGQLRGSRTLG